MYRLHLYKKGGYKGFLYRFISVGFCALLVQLNWAMREPRSVGRVTRSDSCAFLYLWCFWVKIVRFGESLAKLCIIMKRNVCFSTLPLLSLLTGAIILFSCKSNLPLSNKVTNQSQPADSVVLNLLGDTLSHMLFSPSVVYAYKMRPQKAENDTLIGTYAVDYLIGELDSSYYGIF